MLQYTRYKKLSFSTWFVFVFLFFYHQNCFCIRNNNKYSELENSNHKWMESRIFTEANNEEDKFYDITQHLRPHHISSQSFTPIKQSINGVGLPKVLNGPPKPPRTMAYKPKEKFEDTETVESKKEMDKILKSIFDPIDKFAKKIEGLNKNLLKSQSPDCFAKLEPMCIRTAYNKATEYKDSKPEKAFLPITKLEVNRLLNQVIFFNDKYQCFTLFCNSLPTSYTRLESEVTAKDLNSVSAPVINNNLENKYIFFDVKNFLIQFINGEEKWKILDGRRILASLIWFKKSQLGNLCLPYVQAEEKKNYENDIKRKKLKVKFRYSDPIIHPIEYFRSGSLHCFDIKANEETPIIQNKLSVSIPFNLNTRPYIYLADAAIEMVSCLPNKYVDVFISGSEKSIIKKILSPLSLSGPVYNPIKANNILQNWVRKCPKLRVLSGTEELFVLDQFNFEVLSMTFFPTEKKIRLFGKATKEPLLPMSTKEELQVKSRKKISKYSKEFLEYYEMSKPVVGHLIVTGEKPFKVNDAVRQQAVIPTVFILKGLVRNSNFFLDGCFLTS